MIVSDSYFDRALAEHFAEHRDDSIEYDDEVCCVPYRRYIHHGGRGFVDAEQHEVREGQALLERCGYWSETGTIIAESRSWGDRRASVTSVRLAGHTYYTVDVSTPDDHSDIGAVYEDREAAIVAYRDAILDEVRRYKMAREHDDPGIENPWMETDFDVRWELDVLDQPIATA